MDISTVKQIKLKKNINFDIAIKLFISIISLSVSFIIARHTSQINGEKYLFLLPMFYSVLFIVFPALWEYRKGHIGMSLLNVIIFIRYVISPLFRALSVNMPNIRGFIPSDRALQQGMLIILLELVTTFIVIQIFSKRFYRTKKATKFKPFRSKFILIGALLLGLSLFLIFPDLLNRYNFFIVSNEIIDVNLNIPLSGMIILISDLVFVLFPILMIDFFRKKSDINSNFKYVIYSLLTILPSITFFKGTSRFSVVIPTLCFLIILIKLYPKHKIKIFVMVGSILVFVFISFTLYKQFGILQGENSNINLNINEIAYNFDAYMAGPDNMGRVLELERKYGSSITLETLKNDLINNVALLSSFSNSGDTTTAWFNYLLYGHSIYADQIVPLSGQSYLHFGTIGIPLLLIVSLLVMMYFDGKIKNENRIEYVYLYVYITLYSSMAMMVSFGSIYPLFTNMFIPVMIIFSLNRKIKLK